MYTVLCFFRVKKKNVEKFVKMTRKSGDILESHGTISHHVYFSNMLTGRQGSMGVLNLMEVDEDEELLMAQSVFNSEDHYYEVMKSVKSNDMIHYLDEYLKDLVEMTRVVTSSFTTKHPQ
ncbi:MAG: DUF1428 domain-containing protein [Halobacillus sp.]|uniref:DUF1428 domain-containing protein n=2 Tax=Halobacillus sp. TaxID=56800 RepID=UPI003BAE4F4C